MATKSTLSVEELRQRKAGKFSSFSCKVDQIYDQKIFIICHLICSSNNDGEANSRVCTFSHSKRAYEGNDSEETSRGSEQQWREHTKLYLHVREGSRS